VTEPLVLAYLAGWIGTALGVYVAGSRIRDDRRPPRHPLVWSLVGGSVWPLLLLGALQFGSLAVASKVSASNQDGIDIRI
jgi:hypothetical protein